MADPTYARGMVTDNPGNAIASDYWPFGAKYLAGGADPIPGVYNNHPSALNVLAVGGHVSSLNSKAVGNIGGTSWTKARFDLFDGR